MFLQSRGGSLVDFCAAEDLAVGTVFIGRDATGLVGTMTPPLARKRRLSIGFIQLRAKSLARNHILDIMSKHNYDVWAYLNKDVDARLELIEPKTYPPPICPVILVPQSGIKESQQLKSTQGPRPKVMLQNLSPIDGESDDNGRRIGVGIV